MTVQDAYLNFSLLLNKNNEQKNINIEKYAFVKLYNREIDRFLSDYVELNNSSDNYIFIKDLIVKNYLLKRIEKNTDFVLYENPEDMFIPIHGDFYSEVSSGDCSNVIYNQLKKPNEINIALKNKFNQPSIAWERGLAKISQEGIVVYKKDFEINKSYLSYYKKINKIDIEGYTAVDGNNSTNIDPDTSDYITNMIIDRVVLEVHRNYENPQGMQIAQSRLKPF